jgi:hypothetical protein
MILTSQALHFDTALIGALGHPARANFGFSNGTLRRLFALYVVREVAGL